MYPVEIAPAAVRELKKLDPQTRKRVEDTIRALAADPRPQGVKKLVGRVDAWRVRTRDERIIYTLHDGPFHDRRMRYEGRVLIERIGNRRDVYR